MTTKDDRHYVGVQLQQGKIQLDADWKDANTSSARFFGIYRGQVVRNADPLSRMRLLVRVPDVLGDQEAWAVPCIPIGTSVVPEVGNGVWMMFERGDPAYPVWIGTWPGSE